MDEPTSKSTVGANHPDSSERTPDYILVIHPRADIGAPKVAIQRWRVKKLGRKGWERFVGLVNELWTRIEQAMQSLALHYKR
jgi:L-ascorbate metabolism protein UlaG (beta-lactamase superfamily)